jgi:hypothetical protein
VSYGSHQSGGRTLSCRLENQVFRPTPPPEPACDIDRLEFSPDARYADQNHWVAVLGYFAVALEASQPPPSASINATLACSRVESTCKAVSSALSRVVWAVMTLL